MNDNILDDYIEKPRGQHWRRALLPTWIKIFVWIFMILGVMMIPICIFGLLGNPIALEIYGYRSNDLLSPMGLIIAIVFLFKGVVAFCLWFEKDLATRLAIVDAAVGILFCILSMAGVSIMSDSPGPFMLRLELVAIVPNLIKMVMRICDAKNTWLRKIRDVNEPLWISPVSTLSRPRVKSRAFSVTFFKLIQSESH